MRRLSPYYRRVKISACAAALFFIVVAFFAGACYRYDSVRIDEKMYIAKTGSPCEKTGFDSLSEYEACMRQAKKFIFHRKKYFCLVVSSSPQAEVNNAAVRLAIEGKTNSAEILFNTILSERKTKAAVENNLGILCELSGRADEAVRMYSAACLLEPGNNIFKRNAANLMSAND